MGEVRGKKTTSHVKCIGKREGEWETALSEPRRL